MTDDRPVPPAGQWPDASLLPADDAPPIEWARFYRDHCGWIVLPTAGPRDVLAYAISVHNEAIASYAAYHGDVPEDVSLAMWDHAREIADATLGRPIGYIYNAWIAKVTTAADVTDEMLRYAWEPLERSRGPREEADRRGICILPNRSSRGLPVCLVDVDPRHGGDNEGEWGMRLPGPKASTPNGGVHTLMIATGKETASADLGPGVDVVAGGGTTIPLPAGSATPGRRWLRWEPPVVAPDALRQRGKKKAPPRPSAVATTREPGDDLEEDGRAASIISTEVGDGERNWAASIIVGILARPRACPDDFVRACLDLLAEYHADIADADYVRAEQARWQAALTRGPRDAEFAAEVLGVWAHVRDTSRFPWSTRKTNAVARSLWKTCDRREEGRAGAEDFSVGPVLGTWPTHWAPLPAPPNPPPAATDAPDHAPPHAEQEPRHDAPPPYPPPSPEQAAAAIAASAVPPSPAWRGGIDPRTYTLSLSESYTDDDIDRDMDREPIQIGRVFPAIDFLTGEPLDGRPESLLPPVWHGWGEHVAAAMGGLAGGDFIVIGAAGAGAGKTWFVGWLVHGLALATAARILGLPGYKDAPVVLPVWVSEMPKKGELYLRAAVSHLGFDMSCVTAGRRAHESAGVLAHAARLPNWTPQQVVDRARQAERLHGRDPRLPLCTARYRVIKEIALGRLPRLTRRMGVTLDHRSGATLVDHLADSVDTFRDSLAADAGVSSDKVLPVVVIDPAQRFAGTGSSERQMIDALLTAANETLCRELGAAVIVTSDTTKAAVRSASTIDVFLSAPRGPLGADIFAGSQGIEHHATTTVAIQAEPVQQAGDFTTRTWLRFFKNRAGVIDEVAYPFVWEKAFGRFRAEAPEPLRPPPLPPERRGDQYGQQQRGSAYTGPTPTDPKILPGYTRSVRDRGGLVD